MARGLGGRHPWRVRAREVVRALEDDWKMTWQTPVGAEMGEGRFGGLHSFIVNFKVLIPPLRSLLIEVMKFHFISTWT